jgi:hypothetical protein
MFFLWVDQQIHFGGKDQRLVARVYLIFRHLGESDSLSLFLAIVGASRVKAACCDA